MYVCMHAYMYVIMAMCIYSCMYAYVYVIMSMCIYSCMYVYMHVCIYVYMYVCMQARMIYKYKRFTLQGRRYVINTSLKINIISSSFEIGPSRILNVFQSFGIPCSYYYQV
jgi:hypothetical protein